MREGEDRDDQRHCNIIDNSHVILDDSRRGNERNMSSRRGQDPNDRGRG